MEKKEPEKPRLEAASDARASACGPEEMADRIKTMIREMPDIEPPMGLLASVMEAVKTKKVPVWLLAYRWARSPKSITFTPLRLASAMAFSVLLVFSALNLHERANRYIALNGARELIPVVFALNMPEARSVQVIGSFNNWVPLPCELRKDNGSTRWILTMRLEPGRYEYTFLVDGKTMPDPHAVLYQDDGFGNQNTVLSLGKKDEGI